MAAFALCPKPCSECPDRLHHWLEQCTDDDGDEVEPHFVCKHCDATAHMCDECVGPIYPITGQTVCNDCTAGRDDFEP